jgi:Flp pilus assembly CpaE family ATPase
MELTEQAGSGATPSIQGTSAAGGASDGSSVLGNRGAGRLAPRLARVVIGIRDVAFHHEVLDFLDRKPRIEISGAVTDPARFMRLASGGHADVALMCPAVAREAGRRRSSGDDPGPVGLVVAEEMTVPALRDAIEAGAEGVFSWPEERDELVDRISSARSLEVTGRPAGRGRVFAVLGSRGGVGATFVATHLAASFADRGLRTTLVDLDETFSDLRPALGLPADEQVRTVTDLAAVAEELDPEHIEDVLHRHARGFSVLFGPAADNRGERHGAGYPAVIALLAVTRDVVVLHVPRSTDEVVRAALPMADDVVLVSTLDLFSVYGARRAMEVFGLADSSGRCHLVLNSLGRPPLSPADIEHATGIRPAVRFRYDAGVGRAQQRGELLSARRRGAGRAVRRLASMLIASSAREEGEA